MKRARTEMENNGNPSGSRASQAKANVSSEGGARGSAAAHSSATQSVVTESNDTQNTMPMRALLSAISSRSSKFAIKVGTPVINPQSMQFATFLIWISPSEGRTRMSV